MSISWGDYHHQKNPWDWTLFGDDQELYEWATVAYLYDGGQTTKLHRTRSQAENSKYQLLNSPWGREFVRYVRIERNRG